MSVINTNITSLIGQHNLSKSQSALQTAMERLSSGLRINSAKDDAAGQAIANRMSAQITGLNQAARNANDGISIAQTAEGSLNQVNDNLQRIRELTVQAANSTNSAADRQSIQDEINQRLEEVDRISRETSFNSVSVLAEDQGLTIQVGANDNETITVNLKQIDASTLGLASFDVSQMMLSGNIGTDAVAAIGLDSPFETKVPVSVQGNSATDTAYTIEANGIDLTTLPLASPITAESVHQILDSSGNQDGDKYAVLASNGNYYELEENTTTGQYTWDSGSAALDEFVSGIGGVSATAANFSPETVDIGTTTGDANPTALVGVTVGSVSDFFENATGDVEIYRRNDVEIGYAVKGDDDKFYAVDVVDDGSGGFDIVLAGGITTSDLTAQPELLAPIQVSEHNLVDSATAETNVLAGTDNPPVAGANLYNIETVAIPTGQEVYAKVGGGIVVKADNDQYYDATVDADGNVSWESDHEGGDATLVNESDVDVAGGPLTNLYTAPTEDGLYALADDNGYAVKGSDGNYYAATVDEDTGEVTWDSKTAAIDPEDVNEGSAVSEIVTASVSNAAVTGLAANETLHEVLDADGNATGDYVIKSVDAESGKVSHFAAEVEIDTATNTANATKGVEKTVDALANLDAALNQVDSLRSELGAVQNRFEDAINNLRTNSTNLSAARSRIEDADYAVEVANMTRAQILQQAGTSVLAQANQIPQIALSLLG